MSDIDYEVAFEAVLASFHELATTHENLQKKCNRVNWVYARLEEYAGELANTDYRGTPPVEHAIAEKLHEILYAWDHVIDNG